MAKTIEERRERQRQWRAKNKALISKKNKHYYAMNRDQILERQKNPELRQEGGKAWKTAEWKRLNPGLVLAQKERAHARARTEVFEHYGCVCTCCGETHEEFLTIHHTNNDGAEHRRTIKRIGTSFYRWIIQNNFPSDLETHCYNCNCAKGRCGHCPHEREASRLAS